MKRTKQTRIPVSSLVKNAAGVLALRYTSIVLVCLLGATAQLNYRVPGSVLFLALPGMAVALSIFAFILLINQLLSGVSPNHPFRQTLHRMEQFTYLLVFVFVLSSILVYANGRLDGSTPVNRSSEVLAVSSGKINLGLRIPYAWVSLRSWENPDRIERLLLRRGEQHLLWGGQPVLVQIRSGYFGIPWAYHIEPNEEKYNLEILKLAPTASLVWKKLVNFYLDRQRWEEAAAAAHDYLKAYPNDVEFALETGTVFTGVDEYGEGISFLEHAAGREPTYETFQVLAAALIQQGKKKRAAELLEKSVRISPDSWEAYYRLGYMYGEMKMFREATAMFEKVLERQPHFPEVEKQLADLRSKVPVQPEANKKSRKRIFRQS
jgi:hypothetical protein